MVYKLAKQFTNRTNAGGMVYKLDEYKRAEQLTIGPNSLQMAVQQAEYAL